MSAITIPWLGHDDPFPPVETALSNGLLAAGADLNSQRLLAAYRHGIFPWYHPSEPILWWSPHPRTILQCDEFKLSKSLAKTCRQIARRQHLTITTNRAFLQVISYCASLRQQHEGTWISPDIIQAYYQLHQQRHAHSVEVWQDNELVGGLYGVQRGQFFFGESMFSRINDASKIALYYLTLYLKKQLGINYIDCQQATPHIMRLGAKNIDRATFNQLLDQYTPLATPVWGQGELNQHGECLA